MNLVISYVNTLLEFISIYLCIRSFTTRKYIPTGNDIIACLLIVFTLGTIPEKYAIILWISVQLFYVCYCILAYSKNIFIGIILYSCCVIFVLMIQFIVLFVISNINLSIPSEKVGLICNIFSLVLCLTVLLIFPVHKLYSQIIRSFLPIRLIFTNTYLIYFTLLLIFKSNISQMYSYPVFVFTVVSLLVSINVCLIYYENTLKYKDQMLEYYKKNSDIYKSLVDEIRSRQHEYSNRIQTLNTLTVTCKTYEELTSSIRKYTHDYASPLYAYPLLQIDKPLLAASLYSLSGNALK